MTLLHHTGPETETQEWEEGESREWEGPDEFLAGMRRKSRTEMQTFFLDHSELMHVMAGKNTGDSAIGAGSCDAEEE